MEACKGCRQSKTVMSDSLPSSTKQFQAVSRQKLKGLLKKATLPLEPICYYSDSHRGRIADCEGTTTIMYISYVIVWHWHAKDTEPWVICA